MRNDDVFKIYYDGEFYEIPKSSVKFEHGYAVVTQEVNGRTCRNFYFKYDLDFTLTGVIDENYDTVFDFKGYYRKTVVFPDGNVMTKISIIGGDGEQCYQRYVNHHYKIDGKKSRLVKEFDAWEYDIVNDTTIMLKNNVFNSSFEALYDVIKGQFISEKFTSIGKFEKLYEDSDEKFARAILRIPYTNPNYYNDVECFIDEKGNIRSSLFDSHTFSVINTTSEDFDFNKTIESITAQMNEDEHKKTVKLRALVLDIKPKE